MMLRTARGTKAAALQAGSRQARCLIIVEVSACYCRVECGECTGRPRVSAVICRQCSPVSPVLVQQHLPQHGFGKNLKATSCAFCGVLEKSPLLLFSGCTPPCRISYSEIVPLASWLMCTCGTWFSSALTWKDVSSSLSVVSWGVCRDLAPAAFRFCFLHKLTLKGGVGCSAWGNAGILWNSSSFRSGWNWRELGKRWWWMLDSLWNIPLWGK